MSRFRRDNLCLSAYSKRLRNVLLASALTPAVFLAVLDRTEAGQLPVSAFQAYNAANAASIVAGPFSLYSVSVNGIAPTQMNEGFTEVGKKAAGFDLLAPSQLQSNLLTDIEPVVIGPGGTLYLTDGHHTFTALQDSIYGASNPTVYVNVIANYSNLTTAQFWAQMQANNFLLPLNDGVPQTVNVNTGSPIPNSLTGLTSDVYRGLEYSILKNKSSKLFTTSSNITGAIGASTPGLDKMTGLYSDFLEAAAYRNANNGLGLPYLSPIDVAIATKWNLTASSATSLPNIGPVTAAQLPGFILGQNIVVSSAISNATLANGALDGSSATGSFTGVTEINAGTAANPILIGTPNVGFVMQLGNDAGYSVTLSGTNTYTGGTSILAGNLIISSDAALGATTPANWTLDPTNVKSSVQAANGIIFNSLTEGNGTLTIGTSAGGGTSTFTTNRPIAIDGEAATINVNGYVVTLTGQLVSLGTAGVGIGNATGVSDLTIDDNSANKGKLILSTPSPYFYGNIIIGNTNSPTVTVMSDAALGATTGASYAIGQIELNGGTLQVGANISAPERNMFLGGGSQIDINGTTSTWGTLTDVQRTLTIGNSSATAGAITFNNLTISATATLQLDGTASGVTYSGAETVTFTNGIIRTGQDTLIINPSSSTALGSTQKVFDGAASLVNGMAPAWMVTTSASSGAAPYDFLTYGANGYVKATYTSTATLNAGTAGSVVALSGAAALTSAASVYALNTEGRNVSGAYTLTIGDGSHPGGLIIGSGTTISASAVAFGASEGVIWLGGSSTVSSQLTGANGLTFAGSGSVTLSSAANVSGLIQIDSGTVTLSAQNVFSGDAAGVNLSNVKSKPSAAKLTISANNQFSALNSVGNNSTVTISGGAILTIGDSNNLSSTLSAAITDTTVTAGAITKNGTGLLDLSGGKISLAAGSSIYANGGQLRVATGAFSGTAPNIILANGADLQFAQNGGGQYAGAISGAGTLHLIGGTLQLTGTSNAYTGGTIVETGSTLDVTTANISSGNANISNAGGIVVFDQTTSGTYSGVISDGLEMGTGPAMSGTLIKDDSTGANSGNVTLSQAQTFTGMTYVEAGTLTLGAVNTLATSAGIDLGRVGGGSTATLALGANNTIQALSSEANNTTAVNLGSYNLTITTVSGATSSFAGVISGTGGVTVQGAGTQVLSGANTYTGGTTVAGGTLDLGGSNQTTSSLTLTGGAIQNGAVTSSAYNVQNGAISASLGGTGALAMSGPGTVTLSGANAYTGGTTVSGGTLQISGAGTLGATSGTLAVSGGVLDLGGSTQTTGALTLTGGTIQNGSLASSAFNVQNGAISAVLSGSGALTISGSGTVTLTGANTYTGGTTINSGTLALSGAGTLGASSGSLTISGGALDLGSCSATVGLLTMSGGVIRNGVLTSTSGIASSGGSIANLGGAVALTVATGTTTISGTNTYSGATTISSGSLVATTAQALSAASALNVQSGVLDLGGFAQTSGALTLTGGTIQNGSLNAAAFNVQTGTISASLTGSGALIQSGSGVTTLSGANSFTGGVTVQGGTLALTGAGTLGGGALAVSGGTLDLGGSTQTTGALTLTGGVIQNGSLNASGFNVQSGTISAALTGSGALTKTGSGVVVLSGVNTFTGLTTVANGTLTTTGALAGGLTNNAYVNAQGVLDGAIQNNANAVFTVTGTLAANAAFTNAGTLAVGGNAFSGVTTLTNTGAVTIASGGVMTVVNHLVNSGAITIAQGGKLSDDLNNTGTISNAGVYNANVTSNTGTITNSGVWTGNATNTGGTITNSSTWTGAVANNAGSLNNAGAISGGLTNAGTANNSGTIAGGVVNSGSFTNQAGATVSGGVTNTGVANLAGQINGNVVNSGQLSVTGALTVSGGSLSSSGGALEVQTGGSLNASAVNVTGGVLQIDSGAAINAPTVTIAPNAQLIANGGANALTSVAYANNGILNIANGSASNVFAVGSYSGAAGSQLQIGVNLAAGTADRLTANSVSGSSQIVLSFVGANGAGAYNPNGVTLVSSPNAMNPNAFTLAGGPVQRGLFQYDIAYNPDPAFVLVGVPSADAYRLDTVGTATRSIFLDSASILTDRQTSLRDMLVGSLAPLPAPKVIKGPPGADQPASSPSVWATAMGDWSNRSETQTYGVLNKTYAFDTGYQQNTGAMFGGLGASLRNVFGARDALLLGVSGGYLNSEQMFRGTTTSANYEGGSVALSATYLNNGWFADALLKGDFLNLHYSDANVAAFGAKQTWAGAQNYGIIVDGGYRFEFTVPMRSFLEPMATLAYVSTNIGSLNMGGAQIAFGGDDLVRARLGLRGGATLALTSDYRIDGYVAAGYWAHLAGSSTAMINSGSAAPLLVAADRQIMNSGDLGLNLNMISLKGDWSGYLRGDYQFASGFNSGSIKGGISYNF